MYENDLILAIVEQAIFDLKEDIKLSKYHYHDWKRIKNKISACDFIESENYRTFCLFAGISHEMIDSSLSRLKPIIEYNKKIIKELKAKKLIEIRKNKEMK